MADSAGVQRDPEMEWFGARVQDGRYFLSEQVVRLLAEGKVPVAGVEAVLRRGSILEEWANSRRPRSYLVCGSFSSVPLHVVCANNGGDLVVLFAYRPAPPAWASPTRRNQAGGDMASEGGTCFFCGGKLREIIVGNYFYRHQGRMCIVKRLPATLCELCGEKYLGAEVAKRLTALIEAERFSGTEVAQVIEFQPEPAAP